MSFMRKVDFLQIYKPQHHNSFNCHVEIRVIAQN